MLSIAVILVAILAGAGIGSIYGRLIHPAQMAKRLSVICISIVALLVIYDLVLPLIFHQLLGLSLVLRLAAIIGILTPLGFLMGFPFPTGLKLLQETKMPNSTEK